MNRQMAVFALSLGLFLLLIGAIIRENRPAWREYQSEVIEIIPSQTNQIERCLTCHQGIEPISPTHSVEVMGCATCHGGVGAALDQELAHADLIKNPGDLTIVNSTCGTCHISQVYTVQRSIQATYAGAIALVRRAFGAQSDSIPIMGMHAIQAESGGDLTVTSLDQFHTTPDDPPLLQSFEKNCLNCHLQGEPLDSPYFFRGTGCSSCHVLYSNDGLYQGNDPTISKTDSGHPIRHEMTIQIPYWQCNHCHNRGNYELPTMRFVPRQDEIPIWLDAAERRAAEYYQPIAQFTRCEWELDCIDCHTQQEAMGDGHLYNDQKAMQYIQCQTCHGSLNELPQTAQLNNQTVVITERGEYFKHVTQREDGSFELTGKVTSITYDIPLVMGSTCQQNPDQQESQYCHECHTDK